MIYDRILKKHPKSTQQCQNKTKTKKKRTAVQDLNLIEYTIDVLGC